MRGLPSRTMHVVRPPVLADEVVTAAVHAAVIPATLGAGLLGSATARGSEEHRKDDEAAHASTVALAPDPSAPPRLGAPDREVTDATGAASAVAAQSAELLLESRAFGRQAAATPSRRLSRQRCAVGRGHDLSVAVARRCG